MPKREGAGEVTGMRRERTQWSEVRESQMRGERKNEDVTALFLAYLFINLFTPFLKISA